METRQSSRVVGVAAQARDRRWLALVALCVGQLMIIVDQTIVNVALPSIQQGLQFSQTSLSWVVNAYMLTFGGFLLLAGRSGDLVGRRRLLVAGLSVFTVASLACGLAQSQSLLIATRAVQGLGGSLISASALALIAPLFPSAGERSRALAVWSFASAGGGTLGQVAGGVLTHLLSWHWIFLVNAPIGLATVALALIAVPYDGARADARLDIPGALSVTAAITLAVVAILTGDAAGWVAGRTLGAVGAALALAALSIAIEARTREPLLSRGMLLRPTTATANIIIALVTGALFGWFFLSALYLERILGFDVLAVGLGYLPVSVVIAASSLGLSSRLIARCGTKAVLLIGLALLTAGLALFGRVPIGGQYEADVLPAMIVLGFGGGLVFPSAFMAAIGSGPAEEAGLASGLANTSQQLGGALGLAILVGVATRRAAGPSHVPATEALVEGFHIGFIVAAALVGIAFLITAAFLHVPGKPGVPGAARTPGSTEDAA